MNWQLIRCGECDKIMGVYNEDCADCHYFYCQEHIGMSEK